MLVELAVANLGVIDELALVLGPGMTALTGETGAGKTLLVEAIELLMGGRADPLLVRPGATEATVEGRFVVNGEERVVTRVVPEQGRSRAYVDGRMATATVLAELGGALVDLHGQHDHQSLLSGAVQREALDRFAHVDLTPVSSARAALAGVTAELAALGGDAGARAREADLLAFQRGELEAAGLHDPAEDEALSLEEDRLADAVAHREAAAIAQAALTGDGDGASPSGAAPSALDALGTATGALGNRRPFASVAERLRSIQAELADAATELRSLAETIEDDPARVAAVRERRQLLHDLVRKYGSARIEGTATAGEAPSRTAATAALSGVIAYGLAVSERLDALAAHDERAAALEARAEALAAAQLEAEAVVGRSRRTAAPRLARAVSSHLGELGMAKARLEVKVGDGFGDDVAFLLSANPGSPPLPLTRVASGGELARTMLALRLVLSSSPPTLVFDEVDAGIGGTAALAVGRALAALGADRQVLVVTHLPQVAAFADAQVAVAKQARGRRTVSTADPVHGVDRVVELSRMLSGSPDSSVAREHAAELLSGAARERGR